MRAAFIATALITCSVFGATSTFAQTRDWPGKADGAPAPPYVGFTVGACADFVAALTKNPDYYIGFVRGYLTVLNSFRPNGGSVLGKSRFSEYGPKLEEFCKSNPRIELSVAIEQVLKDFTPLDWNELPASNVAPRK